MIKNKILITGGPTDEYIDEVMKITNMSTGSISKSLANDFLAKGNDVTLIINHKIYLEDIKQDNLKIIQVETTEEMMNALEKESKSEKYDCLIHASAVGDYKGEYTFLLEDAAKAIFEKKDTFNSVEDVLKLLKSDEIKIDSSSKISSYQENLTVKLALTPKIISSLRGWFKDSLIIGCKLLENVDKEELFGAGKGLCNKNDVDYILANDLLDLRQGDPTRYLVDSNGFTGTKLKDSNDIVDFVVSKLGDR